ncbi:hypothetical protein ACH5RR_018550 [Cinchona calisaya]|uniref:Retrotransposon Copia-like N-terminal domain-containing protein n=1 Tax=Cinchona calisaya TaxID=153742 RepID=A0ABD2ZLS0_9GENT
MVEMAASGERQSTFTSRGGSGSRGEPNQTTMSLGGDVSHHSFQLTSHKLDGRNYLEWAQSVKLAIDGRGKLGHLTGEVKKPEVGDPWMSAWQSENSLISAWLINSMEPTIGKPYFSLPNARDIWEVLRETYSDVENFSQIFELKTKLWKSRQGEREVTIHYNEMVSLWQDLDQC